MHLAHMADTEGWPAAWHRPSRERAARSAASGVADCAASGVAAFAKDHATRPSVMTRAPPYLSAKNPAGTCHNAPAACASLCA